MTRGTTRNLLAQEIFLRRCTSFRTESPEEVGTDGEIDRLNEEAQFAFTAAESFLNVQDAWDEADASVDAPAPVRAKKTNGHLPHPVAVTEHPALVADA